MQRITVGKLPDGTRVFDRKPYVDIPGAEVIYYPTISKDALVGLLNGTLEEVQGILLRTANI